LKVHGFSHAVNCCPKHLSSRAKKDHPLAGDLA
jgi:hypothetical protein